MTQTDHLQKRMHGKGQLSGLTAAAQMLAVTLCLAGGQSAWAAEHTDALGAPDWLVIGKEGTIFKRYPRQATELEPKTEACRLEPGQKVELWGPPLELTTGYFLVNMRNFPEGCRFSSGFFYTGHVESISATVRKQTTAGGYRLKIKDDIWFRRGTGHPDTLNIGEDKCTLHWNEEIDLQGPPLIFDEKFYVVNLERFLPGCPFSLGLVPINGADIISPPPPHTGDEPFQGPLGFAYAKASAQVADRMPGSGWCYLGVARALSQVLGYDPWARNGIPGNSAYQFGRWANANPAELARIFGLKRAYYPALKAPIGSVFVYEPGYQGANRTHGHIEIKVSSTTVCSDYCAWINRAPSGLYVPIR